MSLTKKEFEGITIELTDQGVQAVEKLEAKIDCLQTLADSKDGEIKTLTDKVSETEAALDVAKKQQLTDADVEALVTERVALTDSAKALFDKVETEGKSPREIKEQVINHHLNDSIDLTDKDDAYVNASFATLQATAKKTPGKGLLTLADSLKPAPKKETTLNDWRQPVIAAHQNKMDAFKGSKE